MLADSAILLGDSHELLKTLPKNQFSLLLTDPPYCVSRKNNFSTIKRQGVDFGAWDQNFDQLKWIALAEPLLRPGASLVIWNDWKKLGDIAQFLETLNISVKRILTWHKNNPKPFNTKYMFAQATEHAIWAVKKPNKSFKKVYNGGYHHGVFKFPVELNSSHPTKKPDALFSELITKLTNPGDWILDPFAGSGTTAICAEKLNRKHLSIELDPSYHQLSLDQLAEVKATQIRN